ncbi:glutamate receptor 3.6-like [Dorcoceras hygrometricum]|uniref:Glutamate receptor 3.6-like n=1 Tax=Dorcoceras hygrometricum TaxID=472368 RepID=A0A2Z7ARM4_9LAMI|nr:glutamate receptor 3.6-like [Dorcoceras hygrometricum]
MESAVMTSALMSSQSAVGYQRRCYLEIAIAKRCRLHKLIRQRFAKDSADVLCVEIQQSQDTSWKHMFNTSWTTRSKQQQHPVESLYEPTVAMNTVASFVYPVASSTHPVASFGSRCKKRRSREAWQTDARSNRSDEPAAKQLTTYEEISKLDVNC